MTVSIWVLVAVVIAAVILGFVMFYAGFTYRKKSSETQIGSARDEAKRIINDAIKTAETKKKEALLEAKEELLKERTEQEKELKERLVEVTRQENGCSKEKKFSIRSTTISTVRKSSLPRSSKRLKSCRRK